MAIETVTGGDSQKIRDLLASDDDVVFEVDPAFDYNVGSTPFLVNVGPIKRARFNGARLWAPRGAFKVIGHPQGWVGKNAIHLEGADITGDGSGVGVVLRNPNFLFLRDFQFENCKTALRQTNTQAASWSEHNSYDDLRIVSCGTGIEFLRGAGNPSMRGTHVGGNTNIWGTEHPFVAKGVDLYSSDIRIHCWAKENTGTAVACMEDVGIRGTDLDFEIENPCDLGVFIEGRDIDRGYIRAHFAHQATVYGICPAGRVPPSRFTYDVGVDRQPQDPWMQI